ncbi:hypothetical protein FOH10_00455 [Nocardia otitidiscaviarum]|uniref:DUF3558 domain-containing protein n=1 Tax=Nocardia otitidiscaviarum TaxID=1823 RepID=A0A516NEV6_9NOCA|nr:hypothetical protein [Nocardia otitidiscaviarum]MCP9622691.1 hypothetical protein [Nocardia otitidiscaviarum]QDP77433.1 hypothetical protein FOH10_00455 [Nocardia otitidiscaviarum]
MQKVWHSLIVALSCSVVVACGSSSEGGGIDIGAQPSDFLEIELCQMFLAFARDDLGIVNVWFDDSKGYDPEESVGMNGYCVLTEKNGNSTIGTLKVRNPGRHGTIEPGDPDFQPEDGYEEKVWMTSDNQYRTQVGSWVSDVRFNKSNIQTVNGALEFSSEEVDKTIDFLIKVARDVQK